MMLQNFYGGGLVQDPSHQRNVMEWLRSVGYDVDAMFPQEMTLDPVNPGFIPGMGAQSNAEMRNMRQSIPGGTGWDGANAKMAWLAQRAMEQRRAQKARVGTPGNPNVMPAYGGGKATPQGAPPGMGAMSNQEMQLLRSGKGGFGGIGRLLGRIF